LPTEESATVALRTQQVIAWESGVANTVDPFGGAYAIEALTDRIEREAAALIARIDGLGGTLAAIESGFIQREIQDAAYRAQQRVDSGESIVVGVNRYAADRGDEVAGSGRGEAAAGEGQAIATLRIDPAMEAHQIERVREVRATRDAAAWWAALDAVSAAARGTDNLVPPIVAAVEAQATVGEIADAMRAVFGEHKEIDV
jgi:methylmalonyl-CoA mutase, N-terminal domain